jgi:hypothetical protein
MNFSVWAGIEAWDFPDQHASLDAFSRFSDDDGEQFAADNRIVHVANSLCLKCWLRVAGESAKNCETFSFTRNRVINFRNAQADTDSPNALFR